MFPIFNQPEPRPRSPGLTTAQTHSTPTPETLACPASLGENCRQTETSAAKTRGCGFSFNLQPSTFNFQPSTFNLQPSTFKTLGWLIGGAVLLFFASSSPASAQTTLVEEEFDDPTAFGWNVGGRGPACLTVTGTSPPGSIPNCNTRQNLNPPVTDPIGGGTLRLTDVRNDQQTFAFYNFPIPATSGLVITFDYYSYGGEAIDIPPGSSQADGITFFLFEGSTPNTLAEPGAFGGSLGYAQKTDPTDEPGLTNGFVGVGFDEFGNFANNNEGRAIGGECPMPPYPMAAPGRVPDSVTIRGSGNGQVGYCFLENSGSLVPGNNFNSPNGIDNPSVPATGPRDPAVRTVRITLDTNFVLTVEIDFNGGGDSFQQVGQVNLLDSSQFPNQDSPPETFKFGFAASTGAATNIHEVQNLLITTLVDAPAPDLQIQKTSNTDSFVAGETGEYTLTVTNVGEGATTSAVTVTDTLPPGFSLESFSGNGWTCVENPAGTVTCTYIGNPNATDPANDPPLAPGETQSVVLTVNVPNTPGTTATNTATVSATGDENPNNNTATEETPLTGIIVPSKTGTLVDANNNGLAEPGEVITYTLTIRNASSITPSIDTIFQDQIPEGTTYIPGTTTLNGTAVADAPGNTMPFSGNGAPVNSPGSPPGQIAPAQTATVQFQVSINNPPGVTTIRNIGVVSSPQVTPPVETPPSEIPVGGIPQQLVNKTAALEDTNNNGVGDPGEVIAYTITVLNNGNTPYTNAQITDQAPENTTYVPNSTTLNGTPLPDEAGNTPFADGGLVSSPSQPLANGIVNPGAAEAATAQFRVRINQSLSEGVTEVANIATFTSNEVPPTSTTPSTNIPLVPGVPGEPNLRLVKRITQVNGTPFNELVDVPNFDNDDPGIWPATLQPVGLAQISEQTPLQSGDVVEYTIYFISDGSQAARNIQFCDVIATGLTFIPDSFAPGQGILVNQNGQATPQTNASDSDRGSFASPLAPVTAPCPDANNPNGSVLVQLGDIPSTAPNNAGFVRFRVRID